MFCPKCKAEYRKGFYKCTDCAVDLVEELPEEPEGKYTEFEVVFTTTLIDQILLVKSLLEAEQIPYFVQNEYIASIYARMPVRFMVSKQYADRVKEILKDIL